MAKTFIDINVSLGSGAGVTDAIDLNFTPDGDIAATNVQDAIVEVRDDTDVKLTAKQDLSEKGQPNGYASLGSDGRIPSSQLSINALEYKGMWDAATNTPSLTSGIGTTGDTYAVSVAGSTNLDGITDWQIGDFLLFNGTTWEKMDNTDVVLSVNSQIGNVVLDTDDITEGATNLYYTNARFDSAFALKNTDDLSEGVGNLYYTQARFDSAFAAKDTDDLSEGATNLYYTEARVSANTDVAANTAHRDGGASKHDASEIDVEGTLTNSPAAPADLETVLAELDANLQTKFVTVVEAAGGQAAFEAAVLAADAAGGGRVLLNSGTYNFGSTSSIFTGINNVVIEGQGPSTRVEFNSTNGELMRFNPTNTSVAVALNNYAARATSIFTSTAANAANFLAGDYVIIRGANTDTGEQDAEFNIVEVNGDGGTGEVQLRYRTTLTQTSVTVDRFRDNAFNIVRNIRIVETGGASDRGLAFANAAFCKVENVSFEGPGGFRLGCIDLSDCAHMRVSDNLFNYMDLSSGMQVNDSVNVNIERNIFRGLNPSGGAAVNPIRFENRAHDVQINENQFFEIRANAAIEFDDAPGGRHLVSNNIIVGVEGGGITIEGYDVQVSDNIIKNTTGTGITVQSNNNRVQITGNKLINPANGIFVFSGGEDYVISNNSIFSSSIGIIAVAITGVIEGNVITNPSSDGINVGLARSVIISDNSISDASNRSIHITDGSVEVTCCNNAIYNSGGVAIECRGNANGAVERTVIANNIISRAVSAAGNAILVTGGIDISIMQNMIRNYTTNAIRLEDQSSPVIGTDWILARLNNVRGLTITDASTGANNDIADNVT